MLAGERKKNKKKGKKNKNLEVEGRFLPLSWLLNPDESIVIPAFPKLEVLLPILTLSSTQLDVAAHKGGCAGHILPYRAHWCPSHFMSSPKGWLHNLITGNHNWCFRPGPICHTPGCSTFYCQPREAMLPKMGQTMVLKRLDHKSSFILDH